MIGPNTESGNRRAPRRAHGPACGNTAAVVARGSRIHAVFRGRAPSRGAALASHRR
jgi:hypothetical protein